MMVGAPNAIDARQRSQPVPQPELKRGAVSVLQRSLHRRRNRLEGGADSATTHINIDKGSHATISRRQIELRRRVGVCAFGPSLGDLLAGNRIIRWVRPGGAGRSFTLQFPYSYSISPKLINVGTGLRNSTANAGGNFSGACLRGRHCDAGLHYDAARSRARGGTFASRIRRSTGKRSP